MSHDSIYQEFRLSLSSIDSSIPRDVDGDHSAIFSWKMASITCLTPYRGRKMAVTLDLAGTISQSTCMRPFQYGSLRVIRLFTWSLRAQE